MLPLIIKPALASLGGMGPDGIPLLVPGSAAYKEWARTLFFVPAIAGGIFGLLGGYLTDRLGRRRVLTFSILLYAGAAFAAGYATRCRNCCSCAAWFSSACAWNLSRRSHGWRNFFLRKNGAKKFSASPRRFHRSADFWSASSMSSPRKLRSIFPPFTADTKRGVTR